MGILSKIPDWRSGKLVFFWTHSEECFDVRVNNNRSNTPLRQNMCARNPHHLVCGGSANPYTALYADPEDLNLIRDSLVVSKISPLRSRKCDKKCPAAIRQGKAFEGHWIAPVKRNLIY